jgi:hypothetical protein
MQGRDSATRAWFIVVLLATLLASCGDVVAPEVGVPQARVSVSPDSVVLDPGGTRALSARIEGTDAELLWSSNAPHTVTVTQQGVLHAVGDGEARVTVVAKHDSTLRAEVSVRVVSSRSDWLQVPPDRASDFVTSIGVNVHLSYFGTVYDRGFESIVLPKLKRLGVRHVRDGGRYYPAADGWNRAVYGRYRRLAEATGGRFTVIVSPAGELETASWSDVSHLGALVDLIGVDNVEAFEGLNEHDISGRSDWVGEARRLQEALFTRVRSDAALKRHTVLGPSLTNPSAATKLGNLSEYMDYAAVHPYPGGKAPTERAITDDLARYSPTNGSRGGWITETGYYTASESTDRGHTSVSERAMGRYTLRLVLHAFAAGVPRTFLYELLDQGSSTSNKEHHFGLLRLDGSEKPAFTGLANLIDLLEDDIDSSFAPSALRFALDGDTVGVHTLMLQKSDGRKYLILWQSAGSFDAERQTDISVDPRQLTLVLDGPATRMREYLPLQSSTPVAERSGSSRIDIKVPDHPLVVEITP